MRGKKVLTYGAALTLGAATIPTASGFADTCNNFKINGEASELCQLQDAVTSLGMTEGTITLLKNIHGDGVVVAEGQNVIIDFAGNTFIHDGALVGSTGTKTQAFQLLKGSTVTMKNGEIYSGVAKMYIQNYSNLTLENMELNASTNTAGLSYVVSNNFGSLTLKGNTNITAPTDKNAFDLWYGMSPVYYDGVSVTLGDDFTGTITGNIEYGAGSAQTGWQDKTQLTIKNGTIKGDIKASSTDALTGANIEITGGKFSIKPTDSQIEEGYLATENSDGTWTIEAKVDLSELEEAINSVTPQMLNNRSYTNASRTALNNAYTAANNAKTTYANTAASQNQTNVDNATTALENAIAALEGYANKNALRNEWLRTIVYDNNIAKALVSEASYNALHAARATAEELLNTEVGTSRQDEVNAATTAMANAANDLVNLASLRTAIDLANYRANNNEGKVTIDSFADYHNTIEAAEAVRDDATLIGTEGKQKVTDAIAAINTAYSALEGLADLSGLDEWFQAVTDKVNKDEDFEMEPILKGYYDEAAEKLAVAPHIGKTQQGYINTLANNLMTAFLTQNGNIGAVKGIQESLARYNELDADDYTAASMQEATDAKDALLDYVLNANVEDLSAEDITADVDPLVNALVEAMNNLVEAADTTALETAIENAEAIDETLYTEESLADLAEALEAAKTVLAEDRSNSDEDQAIVDGAAQALAEAIEALVEKPVTPDTGALTATEKATASRKFTGFIAVACASIALAVASFVAKIKARKNNR